MVPSVASRELRRQWPALVAQIRDAIGDVETDESFPHLDLATDHLRVRLELADDSASIRVPYWYLGAEAEAAVGIAYRIAAMVETQTGLEAIDAQTGLTPGAVTLDEAVARYSRMSEVSRQIGHADGQQPR